MEKLVGDSVVFRGETYRVCKSHNPMTCSGCALEKESLSKCLSLKEETGLNCSGLVREDNTSVHLMRIANKRWKEQLEK